MFMPDLTRTDEIERTVDVRVDRFTLEATLALPRGATGLVVLAHASGSGRESPRNRRLAGALSEGGLATLLLDLLTPAEEAIDRRTGDYRFDVDLLAARLASATGWAGDFPDTRRLRLGYFASGGAAAAALAVAAQLPEAVSAIVAWAGRPDLALDLTRVQAPTLLLVSAEDERAVDLNQSALGALYGAKRLAVVAEADASLDMPGALEAVARQARAWFEQHLTGEG
jgi:dienelactone hydrolase